MPVFVDVPLEQSDVALKYKRLTTILYIRLLYMFILTFIAAAALRGIVEYELSFNYRSILILLIIWMVALIDNNVSYCTKMIGFANPSDRIHYEAIAKRWKQEKDKRWKGVPGVPEFNEDENILDTINNERMFLGNAMKEVPFGFSLAQFSMFTCVSLLYMPPAMNEIYVLAFGTLFTATFGTGYGILLIWRNGKRFRVSKYLL